MTATAERIQVADLKPAEPAGARRPLGLLAAVAAIALAAWSLTLVSGSPTVGDYVRMSVIALWALCGLSLVWRRPREPMGMLILAFAGAGALWALGAGLRADLSAGSGAHDLGSVVQALGVALLPAIGMHILFGLPDGAIAERRRRIPVIVSYVASLRVPCYLWTRP